MNKGKRTSAQPRLEVPLHHIQFAIVYLFYHGQFFKSIGFYGSIAYILILFFRRIK